MQSILEGESLLNDASSLIIFRFALIAVSTGQFVWHEAALSFGWMLIGGVGIGLFVGLIFMKAHKYLPTDTNMDIVLSIVAPYLMYIVAEQVHSSGVLAVVSGGLFLSTRRHTFLGSRSRLRGVNVWESFVFVLNGLVFMIIGLSLPAITAGLEGVSLVSAIGYGLLVTLVLIVGRILSAYGAVIVTLIMRNFINVADASNPGLGGPLLLGWTGMRGVVSLAAALSIPVLLSDGTAFPQRNLILFITFIAILSTLLLQGLTLPYLIRKVNMQDPDQIIPKEEMEAVIRKELADFGLQELKMKYPDQLLKFPSLQLMARKWEQKGFEGDEVLMAADARVIYLDILNKQRKWLLDKNKTDQILDEEIIRKHLQLLDLEEEKLRYL
jgi:CPA1 family monovalent cation:H+ antiporter